MLFLLVDRGPEERGGATDVPGLERKTVAEDFQWSLIYFTLLSGVLMCLL